MKVTSSLLLWGISLTSILSISCKAKQTHSDTKHLSASADSSVENAAILLGMPAGDAWISNNLWPVRDAISQDPGFAGKITSRDNVGKNAALQIVRETAAKVSTDGTLFLMMAGHGSPNGLLQAHDRQFLNSNDIGNAIAQGRANKGRFKRLILVVFSCYSGNWVNGRSPLSQSDAFARADSLDKQLFEMSSDASDRMSMELQASLSRSKGIFEQVLVVSSQVYNQLSWGSHFGNTFGSGYNSLRKSNPDGARIGDLMRFIASNTPMNQPQFRAFPEHEVLNDFLFRPSPYSNKASVAIEGKGNDRVLKIFVPDASNINRLRACIGTNASCAAGNSGDFLKKMEEGGTSSFILDDMGHLDAGTNITFVGFNDGADAVSKNEADADQDSVPNDMDLCPNTPQHKAVWKSGPYIGCAEGQTPVQQVTQTAPKTRGSTIDVLMTYFYDGTEIVPDGDRDGVDDRVDFCYPSASGANVIKSGAFAGCTADEKKRREALMAIFNKSTSQTTAATGGDTDGDGIADEYDRCGKTPQSLRANIIRTGHWMGCAPGEHATR